MEQIAVAIIGILCLLPTSIRLLTQEALAIVCEAIRVAQRICIRQQLIGCVVDRCGLIAFLVSHTAHAASFIVQERQLLADSRRKLGQSATGISVSRLVPQRIRCRLQEAVRVINVGRCTILAICHGQQAILSIIRIFYLFAVRTRDSLEVIPFIIG
ncbi:hypothetical protein D1872_219230 [compost metagenome]